MIKKEQTLLTVHTPSIGVVGLGEEEREENRGDSLEVTSLYHLLALSIYKDFCHFTLMDHALLGIGSLSNYLSQLVDLYPIISH